MTKEQYREEQAAFCSIHDKMMELRRLGEKIQKEAEAFRTSSSSKYADVALEYWVTAMNIYCSTDHQDKMLVEAVKATTAEYEKQRAIEDGAK